MESQSKPPAGFEGTSANSGNNAAGSPTPGFATPGNSAAGNNATSAPPSGSASLGNNAAGAPPPGSASPGNNAAGNNAAGAPPPGSASRGKNATGAPPPGSMWLPGYILRGIAIVLIFLSTVLMGAARETVMLIITDLATDRMETITGSIDATYSAAFLYFIIVNGIAFIYLLISLVISIIDRAGARTTDLVLLITDLLVMVLLFTSDGAAIAINIVAAYGQSGIGWRKVCDLASAWCGRIAASIVLSMVASVAFLLVVMHALMIALHRRSQ